MKRPGAGVRAAMRNIGWMLSSRGLQAVLSLFYLGIATRTLGVEDFGRFALITGASQALITFVGFPTWQIVIQYGVGHILGQDDAALGRLLKACAILDTGVAILGSLIVVAVIRLFAPALGIGPDLVLYVLIFSIVQLLALRSTALGMLRLRDLYSRAAWADSATPIVRLIGAIGAWALLPSVGGFLIGWGAAELVTAFAYWALTARSGDLGRLWRAPFDRKALVRENPGFFRFAFSSNANVTLSLSEKQLPMLLVGAFVGPAAAGAFRLAFQLAQALSKAAQLINRAAFPELVKAERTAELAGLRRMLIRMLLASGAVSLVILIAVLAAGGHLLALVGGKAYQPAYPILIWLAAAGCLDLATVAFEPVLMALHRAGTAFAARVVSTIAIVAATLTLTPHYGAIGAAMALLIGSVVTETLVALATFRAIAKAPPGAALDLAALGRKRAKGAPSPADRA